MPLLKGVFANGKKTVAGNQLPEMGSELGQGVDLLTKST